MPRARDSGPGQRGGPGMVRTGASHRSCRRLRLYLEHQDTQPADDSLTEAGRQLLDFYRLLISVGTIRADGQREVDLQRVKEGKERGERALARKLGVSVPTLSRRISDLRQPGPDPRHPTANPAGRRLGWICVELDRATKGAHKGEYVHQRLLLLLDYDEATTAAARDVRGPRPKAQVGATDHGEAGGNPQVGATDHEEESPNPQVTATDHEEEPLITPEPLITRKGPLTSKDGEAVIIQRQEAYSPEENSGASRGSGGACSNPGDDLAQTEAVRSGPMTVHERVELLKRVVGGEVDPVALGLDSEGEPVVLPEGLEDDCPVIPGEAGWSAAVAEVQPDLSGPMSEGEGRPVFRSMAEEKAWVAQQRRAREVSAADPVEEPGERSWAWDALLVPAGMEPALVEAMLVFERAGMLAGAEVSLESSRLGRYYQHGADAQEVRFGERGADPPAGRRVRGDGAYRLGDAEPGGHQGCPGVP